jgi:hypothetical protein
MPFYYLVPLLAGQVTDLPSGVLSFAPPGLPAGQPFAFPFFLAGAGGVVARDAAGVTSLALHFGSLQLPAGGLTIGGVPCSLPVALTGGQSVTCGA